MKNVVTDVAYDYIRKRILTGEYPPGYSLVTDSLAAEIGVSRTPVRDAFRRLESDGLVTVQPRLGASVKKMGVKDFREMCALRLALESHAAGLAAIHRTETDLIEIRFALKSMHELTERLLSPAREQVLVSELVREDARFHIAIMTAAKNELMKKEILRLHLINLILSVPLALKQPSGHTSQSDARRRAVLAKHDEIGAAIERSDASAAKLTMESHIQEMVDHNLRIMIRAETGVLASEMTADELLYVS
jgi:DNA-binding GntR family transcriptional regulator